MVVASEWSGKAELVSRLYQASESELCCALAYRVSARPLDIPGKLSAVLPLALVILAAQARYVTWTGTMAWTPVVRRA